jgi:Ser/Thr protein kinase RdoA (MazF antagonist)
MTIAILRDVVSKFQIQGSLTNIAPHGNGLINDTFAVTFCQGEANKRYVVQRLNKAIFKKPEDVMENILNVTRHLRKKLKLRGHEDYDRRVLTLVQSHDGNHFAYDGDGHLWRCYTFIEGARNLDIIESPTQAFEAAKTFGAFQHDLMDYDGHRLFETIPMFHNTPARFATLQSAIQEDPKNRAASVKKDIEFALYRETLANSLVSLQEKGLLQERITHGDTKLNNVLLDDKTGEGLCVLDLDTVMPGLSLYDFGDMVRSATNPVAEDEQDISKVKVQVPIFEAIAKGYMEGLEGKLSRIEKENLVTSSKLLAFECGIRFLTDYLQGDTYFKVNRETHNLDRCRVQFALLKSFEEHEDLLTKITLR